MQGTLLPMLAVLGLMLLALMLSPALAESVDLGLSLIHI